MTIFPLMLIRTAGLPLRWVDSLAADWTDEIVAETDWTTQTRQTFDAALFALAASPLRTAVYNARRDFFNRGKPPNAHFKELLAEHLDLPEISQLIENLSFLEKNRVAEQVFFERHEHALRANWQILQHAARDENLRRALLFASHDLLNRLPAFCERPVEQFAKKDRQTALSLLQYFTRAAVKTSPLSRFTTVAVWRFSPSTPPPAPPPNGRGVRDVVAGGSTSPLPFGGGVGGGVEGEEETILSAPKSVVTPNVALLPALYEVLLREPAFYRALSLSLNPCITGRGERLWLYFDGERESFQEMQKHPVADFVVKILLENARRLSFPELLGRLEKEVDASPEQLQSLVFELVDIGLLEWELPEKGLSPGWCGALYNFLGFLKEQPPVVVEAAALLQWLRTTARTLPFQPVEIAQETQHETVRLAQRFFEKNGSEMLPIPPEQIFFEDVEESAEVEVPGEVVRALAEDLAACWRVRDFRRFPAAHARLFSFAEKTIPAGQALGFLRFGKKFLEAEKANAGVENTAITTNRVNTKQEKIGALFHIFKDENGEFRAVVNGLFPGGGKLFARWLHLFSPEVLAQLKTWFNSEIGHSAPFPWQGWSNANFQPPISKTNLAVPDGRTGHLQGGKQILLGNLSVKHGEEGLQLIDNEGGEQVFLTDLGLESPETRPPAMQILWRLGVPYISLDRLLPERKWVPGGEGWKFLERVEYGSLVLARKSWQIDQAVTAQWLSERSDAGFFRRVRKDFLAMRAPRRFFVRLPQQKPQYFDLDSPLSMQLFAKTLRQAKAPVVLTEMLPWPEQCVVRKDGLRAAEFVMEFEV